MLLDAIENPVLRLLRAEPKDEITSAFTREEVAAAHKWVRCSQGLAASARMEHQRRAPSLDGAAHQLDADGVGHPGDDRSDDQQGPAGAEDAPGTEQVDRDRPAHGMTESKVPGYSRLWDRCESTNGRRVTRCRSLSIRGKCVLGR